MPRAEKPPKSRPPRPKLDPRLGYLLTIPPTRLARLKAEEDLAFRKAAEAVARLAPSGGKGGEKEHQRELAAATARLFSPLSHGLHFPAQGRKSPDNPAGWREPYISAFILSDASWRDLERMGAKVRCQQCDVFTAFVPLKAIRALERSRAVRYIELARPWFYDLNQTVTISQSAVLQAAVPPINGTNVIVGVIDSPIDFYHPDFRTAANQSRLLFLWDQNLAPQAGEAGPPIAPALPGFTPTFAGGATYGVDYNQATINAELAAFNPPVTPAYQTVRHNPGTPPFNGNTGHGTIVTGCAAGNALSGGGFIGAAPGANIIFVQARNVAGINLAADNVAVMDAFSYIFARAAQAGQACVVNLSASDNQGPHDGTTLGEQFLDGLLTVPGRAITLSAGNSTNTNAHAGGVVAAGGTANLVLNYLAGAGASDDIEIWYDGHDRFTVTITAPDGTVIGPVAAGAAAAPVGVGGAGVTVTVTSVLNDPRNGDNLISIILTVPGGQTIPAGNWTIALAGTTVINGSFNAWVDRNNRGRSAWQAPFLQANQLTLGVPSTAKRVITVGAHDKTLPTPAITAFSGLGPTRDGRIKPEIATVGTAMTAPIPRNMNSPLAGQPFTLGGLGGTSFSAPFVAGACAQLFQCRGAGATWADLKQILTDTAGTVGLGIPSNAFGFGFLQMGTACAAPATTVDVWLRDHVGDTGVEPFTGGHVWECPDMAVLDAAGNPVANPTHNAAARFNNIIRVTVRNRGAQTARNVEVYLYWGDPGTNIPFPAQWRSTGIYTGGAGFPNLGNLIVIPQLAAGASTTVDFAWAPPAPGSSLSGDNHFCLLARLEEASDPSNIGAGGFTVISASNNLGLRNVQVQP